MSLLSFRQAGGGLTPRTLPRLAFLALALAGAIQAASAAWTPVKAVAAQVLLERAFEQSVIDGQPVRPWPWADMAPLARLMADWPAGRRILWADESAPSRGPLAPLGKAAPGP